MLFEFKSWKLSHESEPKTNKKINGDYEGRLFLITSLNLSTNDFQLFEIKINLKHFRTLNTLITWQYTTD